MVNGLIVAYFKPFFCVDGIGSTDEILWSATVTVCSPQ